MAIYDFSSKVALVTGGASGIGRAVVKKFVLSGAKVIIGDIQNDAGTELRNNLAAKGVSVEFIKVNVASASEVEALIEQVITFFGKLDFAVNCAGIEGAHAGVATHTKEVWDRVLAVNLTGVWLCMKYELPKIEMNGGGVVVNVSSAAGLISSAGTAAYTASKHGVIGLTKAAALEYAPKNIRINSVCPGFVRTPMTEKLISQYPDVEKHLTSREPMKRLGNSEELAESIVWLCSDAASFVTGVSLPVDGGLVRQ